MSCQMSAHQPNTSTCHPSSKFDYLLWVSLFLIVVLYTVFWLVPSLLGDTQWLIAMAESVYILINTVWWGLAIGFVMVGLLAHIPREFVVSILGKDSGLGGLIRAALAGVLLDLCSHGILLIGAKLYERGISAAQLITFLVASPWNSLSLTFILIALIGLPLTLGFILLSLLIAIISGLVFAWLVKRGILPPNPTQIDLPSDFKFWHEAKQRFKNVRYTSALFKKIAVRGLLDSRMVLRWILFGILLAGLVRTFIDIGTFQTYFGPTLAGLGITMVVATILEVCSEGSTPIAADIVTRAQAPGNGFAFLMGGVSTDYTEIMVLKETSRSWKLALFLPLVTLPQVILVGWLINITLVAG